MSNGKYVATFSIPLGILAMLTMLGPLGQPIYAAAHTSGYNHGCSDAQISNPSDRYINQPEKGSSFHSDAFMQAYNEGFGACSGGSNSISNDNSDSSSRDSNSNSNSDSSGSDAGSSKSFGERHTTICGVGPSLLGVTGHFLLGAGLKALCS